MFDFELDLYCIIFEGGIWKMQRWFHILPYSKEFLPTLPENQGQVNFEIMRSFEYTVARGDYVSKSKTKELKN